MKKRNLIFLSLIGLLSIGFTSLSLAGSTTFSEIHEAEAANVSEYYSSIKDEYTGEKLLLALQSLNQTKLRQRVGYKSMPSKFTLTDPGNTEGTVTSFYSGKSKVYTGNMNREHIWPASRTVLGRDKDPLEDDIHTIRPTLIDDNGNRGNSFYVEGMDDKTYGWDPANCGDETYRGDSARIVFYCVVADSKLSLAASNYEPTNKHSMGNLNDLLKWNEKYAVTQREKVRNDAIEKLQGNRNPFIDHPEYVDRIWGETPTPPGPIPPGPTPPEPVPSSGGCGGSVFATSAILSIVSLCGAGLIAIKQLHTKKEHDDEINN